jgi:hypothetical protein
MEGMTRRKKATAWKEGQLGKRTPDMKDCQLGKRTLRMEGMTTRKKDTPHERNE